MTQPSKSSKEHLLRSETLTQLKSSWTKKQAGLKAMALLRCPMMKRPHKPSLHLMNQSLMDVISLSRNLHHKEEIAVVVEEIVEVEVVTAIAITIAEVDIDQEDINKITVNYGLL